MTGCWVLMRSAAAHRLRFQCKRATVAKIVEWHAWHVRKYTSGDDLPPAVVTQTYMDGSWGSSCTAPQLCPQREDPAVIADLRHLTRVQP
jgi:hypothetical protein